LKEAPMFAYHEATKHTVEKLMRSSHALDWANIPEPFRHYEHVPVLDLPADAPAPEAAALSVLRGQPGQPNTRDGAAFLSQLLFHAAAISATKAVRSAGYRYALRVNPSSGNLHPTEFHFATRGLRGWPDGLYHYRASAHMAEQRGEGDWAGEILKHARAPWLRDAPLVFVLTSIAWREAWKYRSRAYRYCLHDTGHAWESLALSARASGCEAFAAGHFADDALTGLLQMADEWPMLIVALRGDGVPIGGAAAPERRWHGGEPNRLSKDAAPYPLIDQVHAATKLAEPLGPAASGAARAEPRRGEVPLPSLAASGASYAEVARRRRSALDFRGGRETIALAQLASLLDAAMRQHRADFEGDLPAGNPARYAQLYLYVHRVDGLEPGVLMQSIFSLASRHPDTPRVAARLTAATVG
jgi:SagB-type dehydrogenase family enzyme